MPDFPESDWRYLRSIFPKLLEELCRRINGEMVAVLADDRLSESDKRKECYALILDRDQVVADCFDDWRRSTAMIRLMFLRKHLLLTPEHLARLSPDTVNQTNVPPDRGRTATIKVGLVTSIKDGELTELSGTIGPFTSKEVKEIPPEIKCSGCGQPLLIVRKDEKERKLLCEILTSIPPEIVNAAERVGSLTCDVCGKKTHFDLLLFGAH